MEIETLLTGTKWEIIRIIADKPASPSELAEKLNTTIANISQQIRLLQTAGIVTRQKVFTAKPGKPRTLFSLADDFGFIIVFSKGFSQKKLLKLDNSKKKVLKEWMKE